MRSVNPATGELIREYEELSAEQVDNALSRAQDAFRAWRDQPVSERGAVLTRAAKLLKQHKAEHARLMTLEMGKPISEAEAEVDKCAWVLEHYAEHAAGLLEPQAVESDANSYVRFDPLGPIFAIMPWNFPFWQVFRFAAPGLAGGNVGVLKHAENTMGCAIAIEKLFEQAGAPAGVFTSLVMSKKLAERVIAHPAIAGVTLTGSDRAGRAVARDAGHHLKKTVLELGGSDPFIVLADADLEAAVSTAVKSRTLNSGQSCIAAKRFIVESAVAERFAEAMVERMRGLQVGDPLDPDTDVGPLARDDLRTTLHEQVADTLKAGCKLLSGGEPIRGPGFFYAPTVLSDVRPGTRAFDEETFGPVAALITADDADDAVRLANRSRYGLGAAIFSADTERAQQLARRLEAGNVFVNGLVKSDPRLPFGGVKDSGYGRELGSWGMREFLNIKTVWVR